MALKHENLAGDSSTTVSFSQPDYDEKVLEDRNKNEEKICKNMLTFHKNGYENSNDTQTAVVTN